MPIYEYIQDEWPNGDSRYLFEIPLEMDHAGWREFCKSIHREAAEAVLREYEGKPVTDDTPSEPDSLILDRALKILRERYGVFQPVSATFESGLTGLEIFTDYDERFRAEEDRIEEFWRGS